MPATGVGRFQVMATLQAARAKALGLSLASAKSWGLNRAIWYAAAKRRLASGTATAKPAKPGKPKVAAEEFRLGSDKAYRVAGRGRPQFTIGGQVQKPADFERQIVRRFTGTFRQAWSESLKIIAAYPREVLESQTAFYDLVYRPRRDKLAKQWNDRAAARAG
ncbi:MAG: hypothetical protein ACT4PY_10025 [Armatimonadota bacterium]